MREMQYSKHREAKTWHELGLMGDTLSYTDEEILTSQALGYVKHTVGKANPMDIAVLYSIVDMGEGVEVTAKDLVNDYTRLASLFESGIIVRGKLNKKKVKCDGIHIERESNEYGRQRRLTYAQGIVTHLDNKEIDYRDYMDVLCGWEVEGYSSSMSESQSSRLKEFETFCRTSVGYAFSDYYFTNIYKGTSKINSRYGTIGWYGLCTRKPDEVCSTHGGNEERNAWVLSPDMKVLSGRNFPISWSNDYINIRYVKEGLTEYNKMLARTYTKHADYKTVLKQINKAVNRMFKRGVLLQTTEGRGRKFKWYDHTWRRVQEKRTQIMASNSKKRKLGDEVNGWVYSKGHVEKSFGMEIVSYIWKPIEELHTYDIVGYHVRFLNEQDAIDYCTAVNNVMRPNNLQVCVDRNIKNGELQFVTPAIRYKNNIVTTELNLRPDVEVESMCTPQQCLVNLQTKGDMWFEMHKDKFLKEPFCYNGDKLNRTKEVTE